MPLTGDTVVTVPPETTFDGVLHGEGTLTVRGGGSAMVLAATADEPRRRRTPRTPPRPPHPPP
ncbi:hypothetical protein ACFWIJ_01560 [Streptomyces sp. NPDC127079]|uniref:hypothetical protein n=1 Tax=Streptomyces sp. NPDC127079 TaxID=3347132 RepID=UPI00366604FD